jgi:hypothetical protein
MTRDNLLTNPPKFQIKLKHFIKKYTLKTEDFIVLAKQ